METIKETTFDSVVEATPDVVNLETNKVETKPENVLLDTFEHLYSYVISVHSEKLNASNIIAIATELMQVVEKYKTMTGSQKKTLVINVIKKLVNSRVDDESDKKTLNTIIDLTLPTVIDNLVDAMNGNIKFDKEKAKSFFRRFLCCA
jgi:hypothetical protein